VLLQMRLLFGMLDQTPWRYYPLTLQLLTEDHEALLKGEQARVQHPVGFRVHEMTAAGTDSCAAAAEADQLVD
jgi:hypothetical protein